MNLTTKLAASLLLLGGASMAQAAVTTYNVTADFNEPQAANMTLFTGSFDWDNVANTMSNFMGTMNSSMAVSTATPNLTLDQNFKVDASASLNNAAGMQSYSIFAVNSDYVYSNGAGNTTGNYITGNGMAYGNPGSMMMGITADGNTANHNAYFQLTFDATAGPLSALATNMVYGDCSTLGLMMMGNVCMGGEKNGVTMMGGTPNSLLIQAAVSAVPVPAAAWLFGGALMSLFGANRRKNVLPA